MLVLVLFFVRITVSVFAPTAFFSSFLLKLITVCDLSSFCLLKHSTLFVTLYCSSLRLRYLAFLALQSFLQCLESSFVLGFRGQGTSSFRFSDKQIWL